MGARPTKDGVSGVHTHMTNSLNTPAEASGVCVSAASAAVFAAAGSGGVGKYRGGDGIVREIEVLTDCEVTLLADRRDRGALGIEWRQRWRVGRASIIRSNGAVEVMPGKFSTRLSVGRRIRIESPGGGGWGVEKSRNLIEE